MTDAADLVLTNAEVHTLTEPDETAEAVAVRDGQIVRVGDAYEVDFLAGLDTEVVDCHGRTVLPGFIDAHTHMQQLGQYQVHADLSEADSPEHAVDLLASEAREDREWVLGFGWDESSWAEDRYLTKADLDSVSEERPVAAVRVDMHTAALNSVALERLRDEMPPEDVRTDDGKPTGVVVEDAIEPVWDAIDPDPAETRELLRAAQQHAVERGVTGVHDMVRQSHAPRAYRELEQAGELDIRVRINYWSDHLDAVEEVGLRTNHGSEKVETGAIKSFTDGSFGGRTAKLTEPYADDPDETGTWVVDPDELHDITKQADEAGLQLTVHAIGDEAITVTLDAFESTENPGEARHRVEHVELVTDEHIERFADSGIVASCQPNFLQWAGEEGLYQSRLGTERREQSNRFRDLLDAGVHLAFSSDVMPMDPLLGVDYAVNAPAESQRLTVTEALRAYTLGGAYAGFAEDRLGTIEVGKQADFTVLDDSPWEHEESIRDIDVAMTVVGGEVVYDGR
ncbi:amidohydrolase [Haloarchaeobius sp. HME9146]|uniref:amidohydrolase n=1 Tax=Haloarchaeobius sp. HME9146 TaxID=2978732 RepID=UPI0021BEAA34|nr:amidohydrolase [Haloarchaeobius sp. HME9146]MCT9097782.1 amidohydrolase [Haloarchaeobius sp. HME9146]